MPSLLDLPRELRDQIYIYALLSPTAPPNIDASFEELTAPRKIYKNPRLSVWSTVVFYNPLDSTITPPSLLFVNKQMRLETLSSLKMINKLPNCSMDLIVADEVVLLSTWTQLPYRHALRFDTVDVSFRISGVYVKGKEYPVGRCTQWRLSDGGGPAMGWQLYAVLERFIRAGTNAEMTTSEAHLHVTARSIRMDVQTPPGIDPKRFNSWPVCAPGPRKWRIEGADVLGPAFLTEFVGGYVTNLLSSRDRDWFTYGQILYEHVDELVLCRDGGEIKRWDVAECLVERQVENKYISQEKMETYKQKTWELRKSRGLKVIEGSSSP